PRTLADGSLHIAVSPGDGCSMTVSSSELRVKAEELQNKFLCYRMRKRPHVLKTEFMPSELTRPMRVQASILAMAFPDDPELRNAITLVLKAQDQQIRGE